MPDVLETALRELREPASPEFAAELDARVAGGFGASPGRVGAPAPRPSRPRRGPSRLRRLLLPAGGLVATAALLFVVVGLARHAGGSDSTSGSGSSASSAETAPAQADSGGSAAASGRGSSGASSSGGGGVAASPSAGRRQVERTVALTLATPARRIEAAAAGISDVAGRFGGYVESSSVDARRTGGGGGFVLRLPVSRLDAAMAALARQGSVTARRQTAEDITGVHDQARSALRQARAERTALLKRLAAATTDAQTVSLRARLRDADATIDRALEAVRRVNRRASYARVDVTLVARSGNGAVSPPPTDDGWGPGAAWSDARRVLEVATGVLVLALAVLGPLAVLALLGLGGRRLATARARSRVLDSA